MIQNTARSGLSNPLSDASYASRRTIISPLEPSSVKTPYSGTYRARLVFRGLLGGVDDEDVLWPVFRDNKVKNRKLLCFLVDLHFEAAAQRPARSACSATFALIE